MGEKLKEVLLEDPAGLDLNVPEVRDATTKRVQQVMTYLRGRAAYKEGKDA